MNMGVAMADSAPMEAEPFFVVRVPRHSLGRLNGLPRDLDGIEALLEEWIADPEVREALYVASPSLVSRLEQWAKAPRSKQGRKLTSSLLKYYIRMCSRPTPFGLFAGVKIGLLADATDLIASKQSIERRHTRLDMSYLESLRSGIGTRQRRNPAVSLKRNQTLHVVNGSAHYIEPYEAKSGRQYRLSSVDIDEPLACILDLATSEQSFDALRDALSQRYPELEPLEIEAYVDSLIQESILRPDISLPLTGNSPAQALITQLDAVGEQPVSTSLRAALSRLEEIDARFGAEPTAYREVSKELAGLPVKAAENRLFQVDFTRGMTKATIDQAFARSVVEKIQLIAELGSTPGPSFKEFISRFNARFEGQMVPLLHILNEEVGVPVSKEGGYSSPLLAGVALRSASPNAASDGGGMNLLQTEVLRQLSLPVNEGATSIHLQSRDLKALLRKDSAPSRQATLPASFAVTLSLFEDPNAGRPLAQFRGCYGPSAANLLGRFCHLDKNLEKWVQSHLVREQAHFGKPVLAEVVHMPDGRPGNVIARPCLREYEISFLGDSGTDEEKIIEVDDLHVFVENSRVKLWSRRLNREVIPRLSSAHNYSQRSLGIYKFLCMLQGQSVKPPEFRLPLALDQASHVPRIMLDNLILSERRWLVPKRDLQGLLLDGKIQKDKWEQLRDRYQLDERVQFSKAYNVLTLDLTNPVLLQILLDEAKGMERLPLREHLPSTLKSVVKDEEHGDDAPYANEVILPIFNPAAHVDTAVSQQHRDRIAIRERRRFAPGSPWMSLKLYGARSSVENVMVSTLSPFIQKAGRDGLYQKWFFMRYGDPDWHLRLRFQGAQKLLYGDLLPQMESLLQGSIDAGLIHGMEMFTYNRETERYGGSQAIALAETLFMKDSQLVLSGLKLVRQSGEDIRWRLAIKGADAVLNAFDYNSAQKFDQIDRLRRGFGQEFNETSQLRRQLGNRYRNFQSRIEQDLSPEAAPLGSVVDRALNEEVDRYGQAIGNIAAEYRRLESEGELLGSIDSIVGSFLHMLANRLFKSEGRAQEFVIYDLLRRHYLAQAERG